MEGKCRYNRKMCPRCSGNHHNKDAWESGECVIECALSQSSSGLCANGKDCLYRHTYAATQPAIAQATTLFTPPTSPFTGSPNQAPPLQLPRTRLLSDQLDRAHHLKLKTAGALPLGSTTSLLIPALPLSAAVI
jgi:hypothetical protein